MANLKCDPDRALELRDRYEQVRPGYHMNKKHWNTVEIESGIPDAELRKMIDHSYDLVVKRLPKSKRVRNKGGSAYAPASSAKMCHTLKSPQSGGLLRRRC
jgi:predicted DNA-binding protein (MmcQ/YjbR family)